MVNNQTLRSKEENNMKIKADTIGIEPTWVNIYSLVERGFLPVTELMPCVRIAATIRSNQKKGLTTIISPESKWTTKKVRA